MITLRPYQQDAVAAALTALGNGQHPVLALPTGAGKAVVIAELCRVLSDKRILVATHRQELLSQNEAQLLRLGLSPDEAGIYSAGLDRREREQRVVFGGIQSIYRVMDGVQAAGRFDVVIVDEGHLVGPRPKKSMYATVFTACPHAQRVALSATPYRLDDGPIWGSLDTCWFDTLAYEIAMEPLIARGYLAPLRGILTAADMPTDGVHVRQGDFVTKELSSKACAEEIVTSAADELCRLGANRKSWIVFCCDVAHTEVMAKALTDRGIVCGVVTGTTPAEERAATIAAARTGAIRALINCETLTTGLDVPRIDLVALVRPTMSKSLLIQQIGRGSRLSPETEKSDAVIIDLSGNLARHKPLDGLPASAQEKTPARQARDTKREKDAQAKLTQHAEWNHAARASLEDPFGPAAPAQVLTVLQVTYAVLPSKQRGVNNLIATYDCLTETHQRRTVKQWVCIEYPATTGRGGRWHAEQWWQRRSAAPCPRSAWQVLTTLKRTLPTPRTITVARDGTFDRVIAEQFAPEDVPRHTTLQDAQEGPREEKTMESTAPPENSRFAWSVDEIATQSVEGLVAFLASQGVRLERGGGDTLYWRGSPRLATAPEMAALKGRKDEIRAYLSGFSHRLPSDNNLLY